MGHIYHLSIINAKGIYVHIYIYNSARQEKGNAINHSYRFPATPPPPPLLLEAGRAPGAQLVAVKPEEDGAGDGEGEGGEGEQAVAPAEPEGGVHGVREEREAEAAQGAGEGADGRRARRVRRPVRVRRVRLRRLEGDDQAARQDRGPDVQDRPVEPVLKRYLRVSCALPKYTQ